MGEREKRFTRLFASAYGPLWAYARRRVASSEFEDIVADVLTIAWRRLDEVPDGDAALPWLYRTAYRTIGNHRRSLARRLRLVERLAVEPPPSDESTDPAVIEALATLRPADQEVLRLAAWEELGPAEIAVVLGCTPHAAALRLSRARAKLREQLTRSGPSRTQAHRKEIDA